MKKINVLHITFNMEIGGTEQVIRQLVLNIDAARYKTTVLCIDGFIGVIGSQLQDEGVSVICIKRRPGFDFNLIKKIRKYIKDNKINIVHCHQYTPYIYGLFGGLGTGAKVVFTEHGRFHPDSYRIKRMILNPILSRLTSEVTAISSATKIALARYELFPLKKIQVIYNGICPPEIATVKKSDLGIGEGVRILGTVSRLDSIKNQKMMINAFKDVLTKIPNAMLLIVGDGPMRESLESQVERLGLDTNVKFVGFKSNALDYMALMELFLLSSFSEGTSMTLLEAMSLSIPCVVTDVGGNSEVVIDKETGLVVPNDDRKSFASAVCSLLSDSTLKRSYGDSASIRFSDCFTVNKMVQAYSALYEKNTISKRMQ